MFLPLLLDFAFVSMNGSLDFLKKQPTKPFVVEKPISLSKIEKRWWENTELQAKTDASVRSDGRDVRDTREVCRGIQIFS